MTISETTHARQLVSTALAAMLYEVSVNPKPGLVDPVDAGPHPDMNVFMFIDSAVSLRRYFDECVAAGEQFTGGLTALPDLFQTIRPAGIEAEKDMFGATHGVNTHKGAIFSLGIMLTAAAFQDRHPKVVPTGNAGLMQVIQKMLAALIDHDLANGDMHDVRNLTAGEYQYVKYGFLGIRGEAAAGFPVVMNHAYPFLARRTGSINERLLDTLLHILLYADDSNLIKRSGNPDILLRVRQWVTRFFELGGSQTAEGVSFLQKLNQKFKQENLSLGGSADLLILTIFLALRNGIIRSDQNTN
ncbi:triphosphoribosyl-dephospho-CoA synthase [Lentilactobacillus kefiri]|uniref:Probable 2-(5''-triphosphoribosyl)-3'-dephosphocoenzyme-A synthase n=2 Tax=Lentilactobacillus kefiri TaxID=33962 RepID=A0A8E1RL33_LENKE|nr:triphosphoribosyl-dephospho-CoA synthase [Lentilactobacillus kefiri]KRL73792.1 triphosphoribosyl-dephospho-CoA synthase [Lentilactobacillus parakefiri DSM 10551]KRM53076.1 triphosphoribosyl-dephospho-CoA synthase [Lentilactobacillus kefiri DSM 20587 = JCM 5818]GEL28870.1 putative 2-(5''-triphosphoribosyl)-3'-dephosphocoenzyme-A synthase [Lentilactobacillus kefiri]